VNLNQKKRKSKEEKTRKRKQVQKKGLKEKGKNPRNGHVHVDRACRPACLPYRPCMSPSVMSPHDTRSMSFKLVGITFNQLQEEEEENAAEKKKHKRKKKRTKSEARTCSCRLHVAFMSPSCRLHVAVMSP
jgi:hypothetical protein